MSMDLLLVKATPFHEAGLTLSVQYVHFSSLNFETNLCMFCFELPRRRLHCLSSVPRRIKFRICCLASHAPTFYKIMASLTRGAIRSMHAGNTSEAYIVQVDDRTLKFSATNTKRSAQFLYLCRFSQSRLFRPIEARSCSPMVWKPPPACSLPNSTAKWPTTPSAPTV